MNLQRAVLSHNKRACRFSYLQRLEEAKGAQSPAAGHQTEGGVVEHLLVVVPAETQHERWVHWHQQGRDIYSGRLRCICAITRTHIYLFVSPFLNVTIYYVVFILIFPGCIGWEKKSQDTLFVPQTGTRCQRNHGLLPSAERTWNIFKFLSHDPFPKMWYNVQLHRRNTLLYPKHTFPRRVWSSHVSVWWRPYSKQYLS